MASVRDCDILFRSGGAEVLRSGRAWRYVRMDGREVEAPTFTRADGTTCATFVDKDGAARTAAAGKLRLSWVDTDSDGVWETPVLLLESSRVNICLQSEDFGTTWSAANTPTRSAGAATCGVVSLDLIGDDSGAVEEYYTQDITFTADAVKAVSLFVKKGPSAPTSGHLFQLHDTTAVANRLVATLTWNGSVPSVVMTTGTHLATQRLAGDVYRLLFQTTAVTAGNTNQLRVPRLVQATEQGNIYVGGVQCEDAPFPSSYIKTTTGAVTRAVDALSFPIGFAPQDITVYVRFPRPAWADASGSIAADDLGLVSIGTSAGRLSLYADDATRVLGVEIDTATTDRQATQSLPAGAAIEMCAQLTDPSGGAGTVRLDVGAGFGSASGAASALTAWAANTITVGGGFGAASAGIHKVLVARGAFTLAEMQAVDW